MPSGPLPISPPVLGVRRRLARRRPRAPPLLRAGRRAGRHSGRAAARRPGLRQQRAAARDRRSRARCRIVQFDQRGCGPQHAGRRDRAQPYRCADRATSKRCAARSASSAGSSAAARGARRSRSRTRRAIATRVTGVLLRGTFLTGRADLDWFFHGVAAFAPEAHETFMRVDSARLASQRRRLARSLLRARRSALRRDRGGLASVRRSLSGECSRLRERVRRGLWRAVGSRRIGASRSRNTACRRITCATLFSRRSSRAARGGKHCAGLPVAIVHGELRSASAGRINAWRVHRACAGSRLAWAAERGSQPVASGDVRALAERGRMFRRERRFLALASSDRDSA